MIFLSDFPIQFGLKIKTASYSSLKTLNRGTVNINRMTSSDPRFPFGGSKASGYGTELSLLALKEFVTAKTIVGN
jgi:succinate-semialdehyde dehydrogenase/glutarate-semialdehyde dehydrogenase